MDRQFAYPKIYLVERYILINTTPAIKKFIPASIPTTHKAVDGKPRTIIKPSKNCIMPTKISSHQKYKVFLFCTANAIEAILSSIKYTPIALVIRIRLNIGAINRNTPVKNNKVPATIFKTKCLE